MSLIIRPPSLGYIYRKPSQLGVYKYTTAIPTSTGDNGMQSEALGTWRDATNERKLVEARDSHVEMDGSLSRPPLAPPRFSNISTNHGH